MSFYPRPRAGGDVSPDVAVQRALRSSCFYPRPRAGGDLASSCTFLLTTSFGFLSAPPCGGRLGQQAPSEADRQIEVSIRAPVRGATRTYEC